MYFHEGNGYFPRHNYVSRHKQVPRPFGPAINSFSNVKYFRLLRATRGARNPNLQVAVTYVRNILIQPIILDFYSELRAFGAPFTLSLVIRHFEVTRENRSRWFSSALWDCFGGRIFNMAANLSPKTVSQCAFTTISTGLPRNLEEANLIARILNFYHMKLSQSLTLEQ